MPRRAEPSVTVLRSFARPDGSETPHQTSSPDKQPYAPQGNPDPR